MQKTINYPRLETQEKVVKEGIDFDFKANEMLKETKSVVETVLKYNKIARNNDLWLIFLTWKAQNLITKINHKNPQSPKETEVGFFVPISAFHDILMPSSISRARRFFNYEQKKYLPDDPQILQKRRVFEEKMKDHYTD